MQNVFLALWSADTVSVAVAILAGCISLAGVLVSINVFRHEGLAGAIAPAQKNRVIFCMVVAVLAGVIGSMISSPLGIWIGIHLLGGTAVYSLSLYDRNANGLIVRRFALRFALGALLSAMGLLVFTYNPFNVLSVELLARVSFLLVFFGYGTAFGLAPMHAGLAELYSKIPSPIAAFVAPLSTLFGIYGVFRFRAEVDALLTDGGMWTGTLLLAFGVATAAFLSVALLFQQNYKKYFAELGMFHGGIILAFAGLGIAGMIPALMHLAATVIVSLALFALAGMLHATYKTTKFSGVRNIFSLVPLASGALVLVLLGSIGMPISGMFMSMMIGVGYGLQFHVVITGILMLAWLGVVCSVASRIVLLRAPVQENAIALTPVRWKISPSIVLVACIALFALEWYIGTQQGIQFFVDAAQVFSVI